MFWRMFRNSFIRGWQGKILAVVTIAFGASLATAMLNVMLGIGDKINRELKTYGANLLVVPQVETLPVEIGGIDFNPLADRQYIDEAEIPKMKTVFWAHNIIGFAPYLDMTVDLPESGRQAVLVGTWFDRQLDLPTGESFRTGVRQIKPWWEISGEWVDDVASGNGRTAMVGHGLAAELGLKPGDRLRVAAETAEGRREAELDVQGILNSGGEDDDRVLVPLPLVQELLGLAGKVARVEVSALTTPENELARKAAADPRALTTKEYETWYCTAYVSSIAYQIEEAIPGVKAKPVLQVSESEGVILGKIQLLMLLLTLAALISSALGISSLMTTKVLERSREIGLLKAVGAEDGAVLLLFLAEATAAGLLGGGLGYGLGVGFAQLIGRTVFAAEIPLNSMVIPVVLLLSVGIALAGSLSAMRMVIRLRPAEVLRGGR
ncbi:ABC transporter permease [Clostridiales bacterium PH28_bin88]|nr:ABC transporter permease [Clostridiales bacterium PH28_bin88]